MDRRNFLKLSALTGLAAFAPINLVLDHKDNETRMIDYLLTNFDDEMIVIGVIKEYSFAVSGGELTNFFKDFVTRQPHVVDFLRSRIQFTRLSDGTLNCSNPRYDRMRKFGDAKHCYIVAKLYHETIGPKFGFKVKKLYDDPDNPGYLIYKDT